MQITYRTCKCEIRLEEHIRIWCRNMMVIVSNIWPPETGDERRRTEKNYEQMRSDNGRAHLWEPSLNGYIRYETLPGFSRRYRARAPSGLAFSKVRQSGDTSVIIYIPQSSAPRVEYNQLRAPPCPKARSRLGNAYIYIRVHANQENEKAQKRT